MNTVERIKKVSKLRKIPVYKMENELGFGNGYFGSLKKGDVPAQRLSMVADYFRVSTSYLLGEADDNGLNFEDWYEIGMDFAHVFVGVDNAPMLVGKKTGIPFERVAYFFAGAQPMSLDDIEKIVGYIGFPLDKITPKYAVQLSKKATQSVGEAGTLMADDFTVAMHGLSKDLTSTNKLALIQMAEQLAEAERKRRKSGEAD